MTEAQRNLLDGTGRYFTVVKTPTGNTGAKKARFTYHLSVLDPNLHPQKVRDLTNNDVRSIEALARHGGLKVVNRTDHSTFFSKAS